MASLFGLQQNVAPYPASMYPARFLTGPTLPRDVGGAKADTALNPQQRMHTVAVIAVLVIGGLLLWHFNYRR